MLFITFEGIDASGKSTQAELLVKRLAASGRSATLFREPGGTVVSERIRSLLLDPSLRVDPLAELLLFSAARAQLVSERIRTALEEGTIVVCDRFYDSTTAYQGAGRNVADLAWVKELNRHVTRGLVPDRTYLVALSPEVALKRRANRSSTHAADRMESGNEAFYRRVAEAYDRLAAEESERILRLDGTMTIEEISDEIWSDLDAVLEQREGTASSG